MATNKPSGNSQTTYQWKSQELRTHQYSYLGPKVAVVAGKLDPTVGQICFRRIIQTMRNLQKGTTEMSSEGPKMVGGRYGSAWNGQKTPKSDDPKWRPSPPSPARFGLVRRRLAGKFYRRGDLVVLLLPGRFVYSGGGRIRLSRLKPDRPKNGLKRPSSGFRVFGVFSRVLGLKMSVLGLGFYWARKTMFI